MRSSIYIYTVLSIITSVQGKEVPFVDVSAYNEASGTTTTTNSFEEYIDVASE